MNKTLVKKECWRTEWEVSHSQKKLLLIKKTLRSNTVSPCEGRIKKNHIRHQRRKPRTSDTTSLLKMVVQMQKKLPVQKWSQSITSSLINVNLKKPQKFVNI